MTLPPTMIGTPPAAGTNAWQSQYEGFSRRETILIRFCGYPEGSSCSRFSFRYWYRGVASEIRFLKRNKISTAIDNGEDMIPAVLLTFCCGGGDCRLCLFKRNWHAIRRGRRWR